MRTGYAWDTVVVFCFHCDLMPDAFLLWFLILRSPALFPVEAAFSLCLVDAFLVLSGTYTFLVNE